MNHWTKKCTALLLSAAMVCTMSVTAFAGSLDHFRPIRTYEGQFTDVGSWYADYVADSFALGLLAGTSDTTFFPDSSVTVGEAVKLAACLHSIYETGAAEFTQGDPWWRVYADYCLENNLIASDFADYSNAVSRGQFAVLLAAALPDEALTVMNELSDGAIPDVRLADSCGEAVYKLYRAGVLTGSDKSGTFRPNTNLRRSEMAAIVSRMVHVTARKSVNIGQNSAALTAEQVYAKCSSAVFALTTYDKEGKAHSSGSGVFLTAAGEAVTNWHVLDGAASAKITTANGKTYNVTGVYDYDAENDLARIQVQGSGFTAMPVNSSAALLTGATVYAIGNPMGLENSISAGIISAARRVVGGVTYIQVTTPISNGSSGGALINEKGQLIGITSASVSNGQNLNLAIPIGALAQLKGETCRSVSTVVNEYIRTLAAGFKLSKSSLTLRPGEEAVITCSIPGIPSGYAVSYEVSTRSIVQCSWGSWNENDSVDLTLTGQNLGDVTVTIKLHDRQETVLAERTIQIRVR